MSAIRFTSTEGLRTVASLFGAYYEFDKSSSVSETQNSWPAVQGWGSEWHRSRPASVYFFSSFKWPGYFLPQR